MILAGDVGGTKILLEAGDFRSGRWEPAHARRYQLAEFETISEVIDAFLDEMGAGGKGHIDAAAIGVAGAVHDNKVKMTNRAWIIDGATVARHLDLPRVTVLNDLAAAAQGVDVLEDDDFIEIQPGAAVQGAPRVVIGVGTGLGVAYIVPNVIAAKPAVDSGVRVKRTLTPESGGMPASAQVTVVPGEGGHVGFSPVSAAQVELWKHMMARRARVEAEDICSGMGIANIYEFLANRRAETSWIAQTAAEQGDPHCRNALDLFAECLGNVAGDHALSVMARGGVILAGGVMAKLAITFNRQRFREAFCAKGHFSNELMQMPVTLASNERIALIGAARVANLLL